MQRSFSKKTNSDDDNDEIDDNNNFITTTETMARTLPSQRPKPNKQDDDRADDRSKQSSLQHEGAATTVHGDRRSANAGANASSNAANVKKRRNTDKQESPASSVGLRTRASVLQEGNIRKDGLSGKK
jgi:hypothetical protein